MVNLSESDLPVAKMQRIILHWTAGSYLVNGLDLEHYHFIVDGEGKVHKGVHSIAQNQAPIRGDYAAHTLNCNGGSIGISMACMADALQHVSNGKYPIKREQAQAFVELAAALCKHYGIEVTPTTVLGHGEVQDTLGIKQRSKWDPMQLPWDMTMSSAQVGAYWRTQIKNKLAVADESVPLWIKVKGPGVVTDLKGLLEDGSSWVEARKVLEALGDPIVSVSTDKTHPEITTVQKKTFVPIYVSGTGYVCARDLTDAYPHLTLGWDSATKTLTLHI